MVLKSDGVPWLHDSPIVCVYLLNRFYYIFADRRFELGASIRRLTTVDEAKDLYRDRSVWLSVLSGHSARDKALR